MSDFYTEVSSELKSFPRKLPHNLNIFLLSQKEAQGIEIKKYVMKNTLIAAAVQTPLKTLFEKGGLTREELARGEQYCEDWELAHKSNHARPSSIYSGLPRSDTTNHHQERTLNDDQLRASSRVEKALRAIAAQNEPRQVRDFKNFKDTKRNHRRYTTNKKLLDILEYAFHQEKAVRTVERLTGINHGTVEVRIKEICGILLTC